MADPKWLTKDRVDVEAMTMWPVEPASNAALKRAHKHIDRKQHYIEECEGTIIKSRERISELRMRIVELEGCPDSIPIPRLNVDEMTARLERSGYGKPGTPNTLWAMVMQACDDVDTLRSTEK